MQFVPEIQRPPSFDFNRPTLVETGVAEYAGKRIPTQEGFKTFDFEYEHIPLEGGQQLLKLCKPLKLQINPETVRFTVLDWGIEMDCLLLGQLPREIARRFLMLLSKAENEALTENEQADWLRISDYVDFQQFTIDRSTPRYMEGTLQSNASVVVVEWHDGSCQHINRNVARALNDVNLGERFSAFVKLGKEDEPLRIERVILLGPTDKNEDWESWPKTSLS